MPRSTLTTAARTPVRRIAATAAATALLAGPAALAAAGPANATGDHGGNAGKASAAVLRTGLDVSLLNKTVDVPLNATLNAVQAPAGAEKTALTAHLDGVDGGRPFSVLRADVAKARATVDDKKAEGFTRLVHAKVHVPGLPLLSLIEVDQVTSRALCVAGHKPVAEANVLGSVTVLGKKVKLTAGGTTQIKVPQVGEVSLTLSDTSTTSTTAAAAALRLKVSVNPLNLNVADVKGDVTLAGATCTAPTAAPAAASPTPQGGSAAEPVTDKASSGKASSGKDLAETGGSSMTPYVAGGAIALLVAGGGAVAVARRGRGLRG
ncbi:SCO1860 family LAETG-anchored protein [Streptomyces beihaiensis]|uniref:LPXTG cell wall anchor domain-containing protein n=1 Tax=Streptomyces beihaiensis TaxID=2984495 RepID=A0ABT3U482_9ACTN|nr:SCO1860 family LAETG-anchored protein [Streptomyces beihaiensis]MCX3064147.1 LPXTG cell wall anchor domain-containing protein [Streptomyces beihaiensis]